MALAELMGSQEDLDITTKMDWEQTVEGMESQGFIMSSHGNKAQYEGNPDLMELSNAEEDLTTFKGDCNMKNKDNISQPTEESFESVLSDQPLFTESFKTEKESHHLENETYECPDNSEEKRGPEKIKHCINTSVKQFKHNSEATVSKTSCSPVHANSETDEPECTRKWPEDSSLYSSEYGKEDIYTTPKRKYNENKEKSFVISDMGTDNNNLISLSSRMNNSYSLQAAVVPGLKTVTSPLKEGALTKNVNYFKSDCMIQTLLQNWNDLLKSGIESDVTITTMEGLSVKAHSLVLMARCPHLYKEIKAHGKLVKWNEIPQKAVNLFLSYLYTGTCKITPGDPSWIELYNISLQYDCKDLVSYMELLNKTKNSPVKIPVVYHERETQDICLEKESRAARNLIEFKSDFISPVGVHTDKVLNVEGLKCISHYERKVHEQTESLYEKESSNSKLKSDHDKHDKIKPFERDKRVQSPDLFDESACAEKSYIISPVANSPLIVIPHHSPNMETDHLEPKELEEVSNVLSKTSSPCKSVSSLGDRGGKIIPSSITTSFLPTSSKEEVIKVDVDVSDMESLDAESKGNSSLIPEHDKCQLVEDDDVIDLTQNSLKSPSENVLDHPGVTNFQTENEWHSWSEKLDRMDEGDKFKNSEPGEADNCYISNIWDDFDADSSVPVAEELNPTSEKLAANSDKSNSADKPDLCLSIHAQSTSHKITPKYASGDYKEKYSKKLNLSNSQEMNSPRCKTKYPVSLQVTEETSFGEFFEGHSTDEILVSAITEIEESRGVYQSRNQAESTSSTVATASYSRALTPKQHYNTNKNTVTPKPEYDKMKSPELKVK